MKRHLLLMFCCLSLAVCGCSHNQGYGPWGARNDGVSTNAWQSYQPWDFYDVAAGPEYLSSPALYPGDPMAGRRMTRRQARRPRNSPAMGSGMMAGSMPLNYGMPGGYGGWGSGMMMGPMMTSCCDPCDMCCEQPSMMWDPGCAAPAMWDPGCAVPAMQSPDCAVPAMRAPDCAVPVMQNPSCAVPLPMGGGEWYQSDPLHPGQVPTPSPDRDAQEFQPPAGAFDAAFREGVMPMPPGYQSAGLTVPPVPPVPASAQVRQAGGRVMSRQMIAAPAQ